MVEAVVQKASSAARTGWLQLTIVEASIAAHALPSVIQNGAYQSYISLVYNKGMYKTASAQGHLGGQNPHWNHRIARLDIRDRTRDSMFISVFASQLGGNQFKSVGTLQVHIDKLI